MATTGKYKVGDEPVQGYRLTSFLGAGNFGSVWKATGPGATEVAIKIINLMMEGALKEFRSLMLVKRIQHPNLVPILAIWLKDPEGELLTEAAFEQADMTGSNFMLDTLTVGAQIREQQSDPAELILAMGLGHKSLHDRLVECKAQGSEGIPRDELLNYMQDAARAIDYLNSPRSELGATWKPIQHCDIKPSNLLLVGDAVQLCDFSLARAVNDLRKTTAAFTPLFAAPEIIASNNPSRSTDQYSLAVAYIELRTGELPFPADVTAHGVMQAHLTGKLDLSRLQPRERDVIQRATARDPDARFTSTGAMVAALRAACEPPGTPPWVRWFRLGIGAAAASLLTAALLFSFTGRGLPKRAALPTECVAAEDVEWVKMTNGLSYADRIICQRHGLEVPFRLIADAGKGRSPFYIMETKVSNRMFRRFADSNPETVHDSLWRQGAKADASDMGVDGEHVDLPVFNVTYFEAEDFAKWLGGTLPTDEDWDAAAGRGSSADGAPRTPGPFLAPANADDRPRVAVDRGETGPVPVGTAEDDVSTPFRCRDMAGNGLEWTSTSQSKMNKPRDLTRYILRGHSYLNPEPLTFAELDDGFSIEAKLATEQDSETSFRIILNDSVP